MNRQERLQIIGEALKIATDEELSVIFFIIRKIMRVHFSHEALKDLAKDLQAKHKP